MKKLLSIIVLIGLNSAGRAQTPFSTINITTPHTNSFTYTGSFSIPGFVTNAPGSLTVGTNVFFGDTMLIGFGKVNFALAYIWNYLQTYGGTGGGMVSGNYIPVISGAGSNLTISNSFTLVDVNDPYLAIGSLNPIVQNLTNWVTGYYPTNSSLTGLTNAYGFSVGNLFPPNCSNTNGPFVLDLDYNSFPLLTNSCGWMMKLNFTGTNFSGPYTFDTNFDGVLTNQFGVVVLTAGVCPSKNGPYYPALAYGPTSFTNCCGNILTVLSGATNYISAVDSITVTNDAPSLYTNLDATHQVFIGNAPLILPPSGPTRQVNTDPLIFISGSSFSQLNGSYYTTGASMTWTNSGPLVDDLYDDVNGFPGHTGNWQITGSISGSAALTFLQANRSGSIGVFRNAGGTFALPFTNVSPVVLFPMYPNSVTWTIQTGVSATTNICFTIFTTNAWRFYAATNIQFYPAPTESISATGLVQEAFYVTNTPIPPLTNTLYLANNGDGILFSETNVGWWSVGPSGRVFRSAPPSYSLSFVITAPALPPSSTVNPVSNCSAYLIAEVGGVTKYMVQGLSWMNTLQQISNFGNPNNNVITIDASGNAKVYLLGKVVYSAPWADATAWSTSIPPDACSFNPLELPCLFMPAELGNNGTTVFVP